MNIIGLLLGGAIIVGLIAAMGIMSRQGVEINDQFRCGDGCEGCSTNPTSCGQFEELRDFHPETGENNSMKQQP